MSDLLEGLGVAFERDVPLGPLTWYGIGGRASVLARPRNAREVAAIVRRCREASAPLYVLGKGANLLVADEGVSGVVITLDEGDLRQFTIDTASATVTAAGGADLEKLIPATVREGLAGLEALAGIPASIGGALRMNAGGAFGSIGPLVRQVTVISPEGIERTLSRSDLQFGYRKSNLGDNIVVEAAFELTRVEDQPALRQKLKDVMAYKKGTQPMAERSAGCAFKNPPPELSNKRGAGKLIDDAGLKGLKIGGAEVSQRHGNFVVVQDGATAADVLAVMSKVQQVVKEKFGIDLEREVVVWP
jgi:UDP-N-acetylmuramate dehydrogenase